MSKEVKRINKVLIVGTLAEVGNLVYKEDMVNKNNEKIVGAITREDFKKPAFVVDVNGQKIGVDVMPTYKKKVDKETNKIVDNDRFQALEKVMGYEVGTRVKIEAQINVGNPYMGKNGVVEPVSITAFTISSSNVPSEDDAIGKINGYIKEIKNETRGEDEDETGRLVLDFWIENYDGTISPFPLVAEKDIAEDLSELYSDGDSVVLDYDIVVKQVGGKKAKSASFGRKESKIVGGFSVTEYSIFNGSESPLDDDSDYYIDEDDFKKLFKEHKLKVEEAKKAKADAEDTKTKKGLGQRKSKIEVDDDDDNPFDD